MATTTTRKRSARKPAQTSTESQTTGTESPNVPATKGTKQVVPERMSAADVMRQAEDNVAAITEETPELREAMARRARFTAAVLLAGYPQSELPPEARAYVIEHGQTAQTVVSDAESHQRSIHEQFKAATTRAAEARALMGAYAFGVTSVSKLSSQTALAAQWYPEDSESARKKKISNLVEAGRIASRVGATPKQFAEISSLVNKAAEKLGSKETLRKIVSEATRYSELRAGVDRVVTERALEAAKGKGPNGQTTGQQRPRRDPDMDVRTWLPNEAEVLTQALVKAAKVKLAFEPAKDGATPAEALRNLRTAIDQYLAAVGEAATV